MKIIKRFSTVVMTAVLIIIMCFPALASNLPSDGNYNVAARLTGGTGRVVVDSPALLTIKDRKMTAKIVLKRSSGTGVTTYSWMKVEGYGDIFNNQGAEGQNSVFTIPVAALDTPLNVLIYSDVMGTEIAYTLTFDSSGLPAETDKSPVQETTTPAGGGNSSNSNGNANNNTGQTIAAVENTNTEKNNSNAGNNDSQNTTETPGEENFESEQEGNEDEKNCSHQYKNGVCELCGEVDSSAIIVQELENGNKIVDINGGVNTTVRMPVEALEIISGSSLTISTAFGIVEFDEDAVEDFISKSSGAVSLSFKNISNDIKYINSDYGIVVELSLTDENGNKLFTGTNIGKARISLRYNKDIPSNEKVKVYYISDTGEEELQGTYNLEMKTVIFEVDHFSVYGLMDRNIETLEKSSNKNVIIIVIIVVVICLGFVSWILFKRRKK